MDDLEKRVQQFNALALPGQPMGVHMGTSYLVNDLWHEVQRLRVEQSAQTETNPTNPTGLIVGLQIFQKCEYMEMYAHDNYVCCAGALEDEDVETLLQNGWVLDTVNIEWRFKVR